MSGPGPDRYSELGFLPLSLAFSFFFMWAISGTGQPSTMVRLMAFKGSGTLKRSIFTVAIYYSLIYFPLIIIFCCARIFLPGMELESDRIMPAAAVFLSTFAGAPWMAGILVAAPFAAVMSTVDSFLLVISSALVRDVYQRNINPQAPERTIKRMSYVFTCVVGFAAVLGAVNPPLFLQDIIVYTGSGLASCFLAPVALGLYWPRVNTWGAMAGMLGGFLFPPVSLRGRLFRLRPFLVLPAPGTRSHHLGPGGLLLPGDCREQGDATAAPRSGPEVLLQATPRELNPVLPRLTRRPCGSTADSFRSATPDTSSPWVRAPLPWSDWTTDRS